MIDFSRELSRITNTNTLLRVLRSDIQKYVEETGADDHEAFGAVDQAMDFLNIASDRIKLMEKDYRDALVAEALKEREEAENSEEEASEPAEGESQEE